MARSMGSIPLKTDQFELSSDLVLESVLSYGSNNHTPLVESHEDDGGLTESFFGLPFISLHEIRIDPEALKAVPGSLTERHRILPLSIANNTITIAIADPLDFPAIEDVRLATGLNVVPVLANQAEIEWAIRQHAGTSMDAGLEPVIRELHRLAEPVAFVAESGMDRLDDAPVVRIINLLIKQALVAGASDIHLEPQHERIRVRYRIDGLLRDMVSLKKPLGPMLVSRLKIMSNLDIGERRLPQDGRIHVEAEGMETHFRVSTIPTIHGEKVVLRVLNNMQTPHTVDQLGFSGRNQELFNELLNYPNGIILVTGPTGSGKTSTLYAILNQLSSTDRNIITVEDPVEYSLAGINQIQVNNRAGLSFANGLRSVLRQDPDVIMVGEIRDTETAELAIQAALTGHLVLSTLHTNSAAGTVTRLVDMGIEPFLISSALRGVIAQRLVRGICPNCGEGYELGAFLARQTHLVYHEGETFFHGRGCSVCMGTGYRGRLALHEILIMNRDISRQIFGSIMEADIETLARETGMVTLFEDGIEKAKAGITSIEEVLKVIHLAG